MITKDVIDSHVVIHEFPVKGSAIVGYFHETGHGSGAFYIALVEQSGVNQYKLRWSDGSTEIFKSIKGKNSGYQYFCLLGYVPIDQYLKGCEYRFSDIDSIGLILEDPCESVVSRYNRQLKEVRRIKAEYKESRSDLPDVIPDGQPLVFVYIFALKRPVVVDGFVSKIYDGDVYANCNQNLKPTSNEDNYVWVPRGSILSLGKFP